jgi:hypothetical protein
MPYEMMSVLVRVAREVLRDSVWGVLLRLYLQHPGMPKKCSFVKLQKILLFLRKMPFCKKKKYSVILNGFCARRLSLF